VTPGGTTPGEHTDIPGAPGTWSINLGNMRYRGEVVVAESFQPEHGEPLPPDLDFELVFFTLPRKIAGEHLRDRRIAIAAPAGSPDERRQGLAAELAAIKETRARYTAGSASGESQPENRAEAPMAKREGQLRALIAKRDAAKYSGGRVYTRQESPIDAPSVFAGDDFDGWVRRLTAAVLDDEVVEFLRDFVRAKGE